MSKIARSYSDKHGLKDLIKELKENVKIPVIGNGDVKSIDDINRMFGHTKCDGIMIGRAALGNPWFFTQIKKYLLNEDFEEITIDERLEICKKHLELLVQTHGEVVGSNNMKKHFAWYFKGLKSASMYRKKFVLAKNYSCLLYTSPSPRDRQKSRMPSSA